ncbi:uncharacterized protein PAN0_012d4498 [Moesziomyces antarcticus]|uniref:Uncharacterized protein n=2 Tax=Pseudozyma antarctica TaxID=84753 RepID=A0A5C3FWC6_PSEA2|nr:uncharacterized protein PAN0_012d4498 [Moesziomyces antarcticus]GAK66276.1 hypothetical protein PAN0_012d4498 [Moesziomyces antarcticus]SPO48530.1 uncharacterized protein PSANT_06221 [Moesziomyces antarcticus]
MIFRREQKAFARPTPAEIRTAAPIPLLFCLKLNRRAIRSDWDVLVGARELHSVCSGSASKVTVGSRVVLAGLATATGLGARSIWSRVGFDGDRATPARAIASGP